MLPALTIKDAAPVVKTDGRAAVVNLSTGSRIKGEEVNTISVDRLSVLIEEVMAEAGTKFAFGRYAEPRELYTNDLFTSEDTDERRTIHLGIDIFCAAGTPVAAPLDGVVEIVANNTRELDYGPLLVLRHTSSKGQPFFTLCGHLDVTTLVSVKAGQSVRGGQTIGWIGRPPHNGNWPPHLHFQIILDLLGLGANFPGVAFASQKEYWLALSPCPAPFFPEYDPMVLEY